MVLLRLLQRWIDQGDVSLVNRILLNGSFTRILYPLLAIFDVTNVDSWFDSSSLRLVFDFHVIHLGNLREFSWFLMLDKGLKTSYLVL